MSNPEKTDPHDDNRRALLNTSIAVLAGSALGMGFGALAKRKSPISLYGSPLKAMPAADDIAHLLSRTSFGITQAEYDLAQSMGYEAYLDYQLDPLAIADTTVDDFITQELPTVAADYPELATYFNSDQQFLPAQQLITATIVRQLFSTRQLFETMVEFWTNHFNVFLFDGPVSIFKTVEDRDLIRANALNDFGSLVRGDARSPAMLYYLDNFTNTVEGPNENYGRELMELHTLGVGGGYTETDVIEVARCFTGWTVDNRNADYFGFSSFNHDSEEKTVLGQTIPAGQGIEDGEQVLDILVDHPSTAAFIAGKLAIRYVSDSPPQSIVDQLAQSYTDNGGDIKIILRTLFLSDEFLDSKDQKFKRPVEFFISALRASEPLIHNNGYRKMVEQLNALGQGHFTYATPDGYPDQLGDWVNTSALLSRWSYSIGIADGTSFEFFDTRIFDLLAGARSPGQIVDALLERILHRTIEEGDRKILVEFVAEGKPENAVLPLSEAIFKARGALGLIFGSRYFQVR